VLAAPLVRFTLEQRQSQSPREEPSVGRTCQTRCMRQQRAGEFFLIKEHQSSIIRAHARPRNTQLTLRYGSAAAQQRAPTRAPMRSPITSANCASMARSRARRDRDGIVGPSMMASRTREAAGWRVSASSCCGGNDSILRGYNQSWTAPGLWHCAHLSSTSALCGGWSRKRDCRSSAPVVVGSRGLDTTASRDCLGNFSGNSSIFESRLDGTVAFALLATAYSCRRLQMD
jgi:hypothetical protein